MIVQLQRQWIEGELTYSDPDRGSTRCAVCSVPFEEPSVVAHGTTDHRDEMGVLCTECVEYLGRRNPERFPSIEEYRELLQRYPRAMYPTADALERAAEEAGLEDPALLVDADSWVWRFRENATA